MQRYNISDYQCRKFCLFRRLKILFYIKENKIRLGEKQKQILEFLKNNEDVELNDLVQLLNASKSSIKSLEEKNLIEFKYEDFYRESKSNF